jgi:AraC-like DNA-binding protein
MGTAPATARPAYEERPAPEAAAWSPCLWVRQATAAATVTVVPDACTDLLWRAGRLEVAGPDTAPRTVPLAAGEVIAGVRLRPGAARVLLGPVPATEIRDTQPDLADLWHRPALADRAAAQTDPWRIAALLADALTARANAPDPVALAVAAALDRPHPPRIPVLAWDLGFSERQLRRRVEQAAGYGPKTLEQILRFHRAMAAAGEDPDWARVAAETGYADQAHLSRQVRRWSGRPPTAR